MISRSIITIGWLGFAGGLIYWMIQNHSGTLNFHYIETTKHILALSAITVVAGYLLMYLGRFLGLGESRCRTCGKRIEKQEMYCFNHRLQTIRKAQDLDRTWDKKKH